MDHPPIAVYTKLYGLLHTFGSSERHPKTLFVRRSMEFAHFRVVGRGSENAFCKKVYAICPRSGRRKGTRKLFLQEGLCYLLTFGSADLFSGPLMRGPETFVGGRSKPNAIFGSTYRLGFKILNWDPKVTSARRPRKGLTLYRAPSG